MPLLKEQLIIAVRCSTVRSSIGLTRLWFISSGPEVWARMAGFVVCSPTRVDVPLRERAANRTKKDLHCRSSTTDFAVKYLVSVLCFAPN